MQALASSGGTHAVAQTADPVQQLSVTPVSSADASRERSSVVEREAMPLCVAACDSSDSSGQTIHLPTFIQIL